MHKAKPKTQADISTLHAHNANQIREILDNVNFS